MKRKPRDAPRPPVLRLSTARGKNSLEFHAPCRSPNPHAGKNSLVSFAQTARGRVIFSKATTLEGTKVIWTRRSSQTHWPPLDFSELLMRFKLPVMTILDTARSRFRSKALPAIRSHLVVPKQDRCESEYRNHASDLWAARLEIWLLKSFCLGYHPLGNPPKEGVWTACLLPTVIDSRLPKLFQKGQSFL